MIPTSLHLREDGYVSRRYLGQVSGQHDKTQPWRQPTLARRMEMPTFNGEEEEGWILRVEEYFELENFYVGREAEISSDEFHRRCPAIASLEMQPKPVSELGAVEVPSIRALEGKRLLTLRQGSTVKECK